MTLGVLQAAVAAVAAIGLAEVVARFALRRSGYFVWQRFYRRVLHVDRETHPYLESDIYFEANAEGERGGTVPTGPGAFRILLLGGSTVESALNDQATSWSGRMQALLNEPSALAAVGARVVYVGNVGRSGVDVRGVSWILKTTLPRYHSLDLIGVMVGPGDLMRWLEDGAPPDRMPAPLAPVNCFAEHPELELSLHPKRLALTEYVRRLRMRLLRPVDVRENAARWMARARRMRREAKRFRTTVPEAGGFLEYFENGLEEVIHRARRAASRVVLIRQPSFRRDRYTPEEEALFWNGGIGNAYRGDLQTEFFTTEVMYSLLDAMDERIRAVAARHGLGFIDPQPALTMSAAAFFDHFHLTQLGSDEVGRAVTAAILADR